MKLLMHFLLWGTLLLMLIQWAFAPVESSDLSFSAWLTLFVCTFVAQSIIAILFKVFLPFWQSRHVGVALFYLLAPYLALLSTALGFFIKYPFFGVKVASVELAHSLFVLAAFLGIFLISPLMLLISSYFEIHKYRRYGLGALVVGMLMVVTLTRTELEGEKIERVVLVAPSLSVLENLINAEDRDRNLFAERSCGHTAPKESGIFWLFWPWQFWSQQLFLQSSPCPEITVADFLLLSSEHRDELQFIKVEITSLDEAESVRRAARASAVMTSDGLIFNLESN